MIIICVFPVILQAETLLPSLEKQDQNRLSSVSQLSVNKISFVGNSIISDAVLHQLALPYEGRVVSASELQELRLNLSRLYISQGYLNSGVLLKDQEIKDGHIIFHVVEGRVKQIHTHGQKRLQRAYIKDYLWREAKLDGVLNMQVLQLGLKRLKQDPRIAVVHAQLNPSQVQGEALLDLKIEETSPWRVHVLANNYGAPSLGYWHSTLHVEHLNLTGYGNSLALDFGLSAGLKDYNLLYRKTLNAARTAWSFQASSSHSLVVSEAFKALSIRSHSQSQRLMLEQPLWHNQHHDVSLSAAYEHKNSFTSLLGVPFSFSVGVQNGRISTHAFLLGQTWAYHTASRVIAVNSQLSIGLDPGIYNSADGRFVTWLGQSQWVERWSLWNSQSIVRTHVRWSNDSLLAVDKFAVGGRNTVRGYRENQWTMDNAVLFSAEWRVPIFQLKLPYVGLASSDGEVSLAPFFDYAHAWNKFGSVDVGAHSLASVGLGLRWQINPSYQFEIYGAKPLQKVSRDGRHSLQDSGIHLELSAQVL
ncbi:MAG: ShlB/FhaC/HecB family hemolysin secretion/activation protein [Mariprofundaceae bacterium]|nr:ShlB/FhaC/HecB family hemolysin secretion/activation protein [Mariprofundaceae bacterium]